MLKSSFGTIQRDDILQLCGIEKGVSLKFLRPSKKTINAQQNSAYGERVYFQRQLLAKTPNTIAADDIQKYFFIVFRANKT